jgi:hypothetical protein
MKIMSLEKQTRLITCHFCNLKSKEMNKCKTCKTYTCRKCLKDGECYKCEAERTTIDLDKLPKTINQIQAIIKT